MQPGQEILRKWDAREACLHPRMEMTCDGLVLGAGAVLAKMAPDKKGASRVALDDEPRAIALLATAFERPIDLRVLAKISHACELWNDGEKALAHIHLAHAGLPLCGEGEALRLFAADELLRSDVTPDALMKAQGVDPAALALLKYSPDQPRVPAGHGRESGQWTSEEASGSENGHPTTRNRAGAMPRKCKHLKWQRLFKSPRMSHAPLSLLKTANEVSCANSQVNI